MGKASSKEKSAGGIGGKAAHGSEGGPKATVEVEVPFDQYAFPFENAVFEGGPLSCLAYVGAVRFLEDVGIWSRIERLAGSGVGAVMASLLSIGFNSHQLQNVFQTELRTLAQDHVCGTCCLGCRMSSEFGWNSNKKIISWFGSKMKEAIGKPDATFSEVYQKFGKQLCLVVTNVSQGRLEYCHPKTTPHLPVVEAVRMSLATPGICSPVKSKPYGEEQYFVEGTCLNAYPIHCFDGWWLSMKPEDSFLKRLTSLGDFPTVADHSNRFGTVNSKTLGFIVYDAGSLELLASKLDERNRIIDKVPLPETKLAKKWNETWNASKATQEKYNKYRNTADKFLQSLTSVIPEEEGKKKKVPTATLR